jgi:hypothetical protein
LPGVTYGLVSQLDNFGFGLAQFLLKMNAGSRDESVNTWFGGIFNGFPATVNIGFMRTRQSADTRTANILRDLFDGFEISSEAIGKPASITSTPRWANCRAMISFSATFSEAPGLCSPSLKVVSKITMRLDMLSLHLFKILFMFLHQKI